MSQVLFPPPVQATTSPRKRASLNSTLTALETGTGSLACKTSRLPSDPWNEQDTVRLLPSASGEAI
jgi:hypothetical protein